MKSTSTSTAKKAILFSFLCCFSLFTFSSLKAQTVESAILDSVGAKCPCSGPLSGGAWKRHLEYVSCVTRATAKMLENHQITARQTAVIVLQATKSDCGGSEPNNNDDSIANEDSPGEILLCGASETTFNQLSVKLNFTLTGARFSSKPEDYDLHINGSQVVFSGLTIGDSVISLTTALSDGLNALSLYALDADGKALEGHYRLWAGSQTLPVVVVDNNGNLVPDAHVKIVLSDDTSVVAEAQTINGKVTFSNVPYRTIIATATTSGNLFGSAAAVGDGSAITIKLNPFYNASPIDNNDISLGTAGWNTGTAPVTVIPHVEGVPTFINKQQLATDDNMDLYLSTSGEGEQKMSRTFTVKAGTKNVRLRYRFVTSEVPGGYFGSQFNDYYSVAIRSKNGGGIVSEQNSMNGLGLSAFDYSTGATAWKQITLPVSVKGDDVQVDVAVANVADGVLDSHVAVDFISEGDLSIGNVTLIDPDKTNTLTYISIDNQPYFNSTVPIYGRITVNGSSDDKLTKLNLEILKDGTTISTVPLSQSAQSALFQTFGEDQTVEISSTALLFEIPNLTAIGSDGKVLFRLTAETESGQTISKDCNSLPNLQQYKGTNRFGTRDEEKGGDDWGLPSTISYTNMLSKTWSVNDISNMNGNKFPPHKSHKDGVDIDAYFPGYNAINKPVAKTLLLFLNSTLGNNVDIVYVTYGKDPGFYDTIKTVTLDDGRKATSVIKYADGHDTHFHIRLKENTNNSKQLLIPKKMSRNLTVQSKPTDKLADDNYLQIYPNPTRGLLTISLKNIGETNGTLLTEIRKLTVYNRSGHPEKTVVFQGDNKSVQIDVRGLPTDTYILEISDGTRKINKSFLLLK